MKQSPNFRGIIISNQKFTERDTDTDTKLGKILGFPCEPLLDEILPKKAANSEPIYTVNIKVELTNEKIVSIIDFMCLKIDEKKKKIEELVTKIKNALSSDNEMKKMV